MTDSRGGAPMESLPDRQVRWMGMIVGIFIIAFGGFIALSGMLLAGLIVVSLLVPSLTAKPPDTFIGVIAATQIAMGVPILLYGLSMFRRARTDSEVISAVVLKDGPRYRRLAWVGIVFSSLLILGLAGAGLGGNATPGTMLNGIWFVLMLAACVRQVRKKTPQQS